ncbi:MAG TPA: hypothetical protein VLC09_21075 [Polyangiaceae bacterium]|nr:hypothetical protein [Polyangiaceae bacterium]
MALGRALLLVAFAALGCCACEERTTYELRLPSDSSEALVERVATASRRVELEDQVAFRTVLLECDPVWYTCANVVDGSVLDGSALTGSWWDPALRLLRVDLNETNTIRLERELRELMASEGPIGEPPP